MPGVHEQQLEARCILENVPHRPPVDAVASMATWVTMLPMLVEEVPADKLE